MCPHALCMRVCVFHFSFSIVLSRRLLFTLTCVKVTLSIRVEIWSSPFLAKRSKTVKVVVNCSRSFVRQIGNRGAGRIYFTSGQHAGGLRGGGRRQIPEAVHQRRVQIRPAPVGLAPAHNPERRSCRLRYKPTLLQLA